MVVCCACLLGKFSIIQARFRFSYSPQKDSVAQLAELMAVNHVVVSSSLTTIAFTTRWLNG